MGAGSGLYAREPEGRVTRLTVAQGLPANEVLALALDAQGRLLAASRSGLVLLDREAFLRRNRHVVRRVLTERDGLPSQNVRSFHIEGHTLWIGTVWGLAEASFTTSGELSVERTLLGFNAWGIATDLRGTVWMATEAGARRLARRGFISYSTEDGLPAQRVASLFETSRGVEFTVLAAFWQRRWFLALAAVCTCALAFVVHRSRVRHAVAVERVRSQTAADLHDGVGASLSRIAILSEVVRQQAHSAPPDACRR